MKSLIYIQILLLAIVSCQTNTQKNNTKESTLYSKKHIDQDSISKIDLLIADTSIIDLPSKQLTKLIDIGGAQSFVDSFGNPLYKPSQVITFKNLDKDSLVNIFNTFLDSISQKNNPTTCITLYNHVFVLYDTKNKIKEQIDFAFDCPMRFDYLQRGLIIEPKNENSKLMTTLIDKLRSAGAFIPSYGSPPILEN
jgi:hypothetical protein